MRTGLNHRLGEISEMLSRAWMDVLKARDGRELWHEVGPFTSGAWGALLHEWYTHWLISTCRRLLDPRPDVSSLTRALDSLAQVAPEITAERIAARWSAKGTDRCPEHVLEDVRGVIADLASDGRTITRNDVRRDRQGLVSAHKQIVDFANQSVAHRPRERRTLTITENDVEALLDDAFDVAYRWNSLVSGSHLSDSTPGPDSLPLVTALRLVDWGDLMGSLEDAEKERGAIFADGDLDAILKRVRIEYVWEDD